MAQNVERETRTGEKDAPMAQYLEHTLNKHYSSPFVVELQRIKRKMDHLAKFHVSRKLMWFEARDEEMDKIRKSFEEQFKQEEIRFEREKFLIGERYRKMELQSLNREMNNLADVHSAQKLILFEAKKVKMDKLRKRFEEPFQEAKMRFEQAKLRMDEAYQKIEKNKELADLFATWHTAYTFFPDDIKSLN